MVTAITAPYVTLAKAQMAGLFRAATVSWDGGDNDDLFSSHDNNR